MVRRTNYVICQTITCTYIHPSSCHDNACIFRGESRGFYRIMEKCDPFTKFER